MAILGARVARYVVGTLGSQKTNAHSGLQFLNGVPGGKTVFARGLCGVHGRSKY